MTDDAVRIKEQYLSANSLSNAVRNHLMHESDFGPYFTEIINKLAYTNENLFHPGPAKDYVQRVRSQVASNLENQIRGSIYVICDERDSFEGQLSPFGEQVSLNLSRLADIYDLISLEENHQTPTEV